MKFTLTLLLAGLLPFSDLFAGSATWTLSPANGNWNTASNWTPATVPNGPSDVARFVSSNTTALSFSASVEVNSIVYNVGTSDSAFTTSVVPSQVLTLSGIGITNNSGIVQNFSVGADPAEITFTNSATAGTQTTFTTAGSVTDFTNGGEVLFADSSTAGDAVFMNNGGTLVNKSGGTVLFFDNSNAGNATITNNGRGNSSAWGGGTTGFSFTSSASTATIINMPNGGVLAGTAFNDVATAENSVITNEGATVNGQIGGNTEFEGNSSAGNSTIICNGGTVTGAGGGIVVFSQSSKTADATLIANGGVNGGDGGEIQLVQRPSAHGNRARVQVFGNGALVHSLAMTTIGSLEGDCIVDIGDAGISVGSNNLSTTFSGPIQGSFAALLTKIGTGTLTLTGTNTYTGETIVSGGKLILSSTATLATSLVEIDAGTLGGDGVIPSPVLVERQGFLAPSAEIHRPTTMTIQSYLDVLSNGTYKCRFQASGSTVRSDQVIANGIIGDSAGNIAFEAKIQGTLVPGTTFTIINNTSANPISGTFANLPDGGIVTINGNNFKASYEGGDGNDLTLTVQ